MYSSCIVENWWGENDVLKFKMFGSVLNLWTKCSPATEISQRLWAVESQTPDLTTQVWYQVKHIKLTPDHHSFSKQWVVSKLRNATPLPPPLTPQMPNWIHPPNIPDSFHTVFTGWWFCSCLLLSAFISGVGVVLLTRWFVESLHFFSFSNSMKQKHPPCSSYWLLTLPD